MSARWQLLRRQLTGCALLLALLWASPVRAAAPLDLSNLSKDTRDRILHIHPDIEIQPQNYQQLELLLKELVLTELYDAVEVVEVKVEGSPRYQLHLGRLQKILSIEFQGIDESSEFELRREFGLSEASSFDQSALIEAGERVRSFLDSQGFSQASVDLEFYRDGEDGIRITAKVKEGPRTIIDDFQILTPNTTLAEGLRRNLRSFRKDPINERSISEIRTEMRRYLSKNSYFRSEVTEPQIEKFDAGKKARMIYQIQNPEQYSVEIEGNRRLSTYSLKGVMALSEFSSSNPNVGAELGSKVKNYYVEQGYARAEVSVRESQGFNNFHRIIKLNVNEGPRIKIRRLDWIGRFSQPAEKYSDFLLEHSSDVFSKGYFVKEDLDLALKNLVTDSWNKGYLRARVVSTRTSYNATRDEITIQINFDEGVLTKITGIRFEGLAQVSENDLRALLLFREGQALKLGDLEDSIQRVRKFYQSLGFLEMLLINERQDLVRYSNDNSSVEVVFQIYEGPKIQVGSIQIEGNTLTQNRVIMKELEFKVGDTLTPDLIEESISRLQRLGHFSAVDIKTLEEKTPISVRSVIVRVTDRDPGIFNLGFGVNNDRGLTVRGYTGIAYRNIMGTGRGVSARADVNYNVNEIKYLEHKLTLGYLEPYLFDTRIRGRINVTRAITVSDYSRRLAAEVNQATYTLEQDITSHMLLAWDVLSIATVRDFLVQSGDQLSLMDIGSTGVTMDIDYRDHPFNPRSGTFTRLNLEYGSPGLMSTHTIEYARGFASLSHYQNMGLWGLVFANSLRVGYLRNLSGRSDGAVPYDKKGLILGGQSTIRGYTPDEAFPNRFDFGAAYDSNKDRYNLTTEAAMQLIKSEIRFPVWGNVGGALFYDGGAVTVRGVDIAEPYRDSAGIALRYSTPVGAVSLEYGWKLRARGDRGETPSAFHFSIGTF